MEKASTIFLLLCCCHLLTSQEVAITIDDFPFRRMSLPASEEPELVNKLYDHLEKYNIRATGFLNSGRINSSNKDALIDFLKRGHKLGNHTRKHSNIDQVGAHRFIEDIDAGLTEGEKYINTMFFRYPYLRRGSTPGRRDSVYRHLERKGYTLAHVSIDNNEWIYNRDYVKARSKGQQNEMDSIATAYLEHMKEVSINYEKKAQRLTDRSVKHILLLHANPINAEYLGDLLEWYQDQGWKFIALEEALKDPIYSLKDTLVSPYGWSQLDRMERILKDQASAPGDR